MPDRFKLFAVVAAVIVVSAACGGGEGDAAADPAQDIANNIAAAAPAAQGGEPAAATGLASAEDIATDIIDGIEAEATPKGGYLASGFFSPFDVTTLSPSQPSGGAAVSGYEGLTTVTVADNDDVLVVWQYRGANDGSRYSCQFSVHIGGVSQLASEVVVSGEDSYYWDPTLADPEIRSLDSPEVADATRLCPAQPGFFDDVPEFFTLGDIVDSSEDAEADGSISGFHVTSRMDAVEAGFDGFEGEVVVTADATRTAADVEVRWPPLSGTLAELAMEEPSP